MANLQFDFESAWYTAAWPAFQTLSQDVLALLSTVAVRCADLRQLSDCSMPWPDDNDTAPESLHSAFRAIPIEQLAYASQVIYSYGHWRPSSAPDNALRDPNGATWKFAHYADQTIREVLGLPPRGDNGRSRGVAFAVHEGILRLTYASNDMWTWTEVAPATPAGLERAKQLAARLRASFAGIPINAHHKRDHAVYTAMEAIRAEVFASEVWSPDWRQIADTQRFMVDSQELERRRLARLPPPNFDKMIADLKARHDKSVAKLNTELAGKLWLLERRQPIENVIYYGHTGVFCWGWREPLNPESVSVVLDYISEFPYPYEIKRTDGPKLSGGLR